jgi:hypothetical protein
MHKCIQANRSLMPVLVLTGLAILLASLISGLYWGPGAAEGVSDPSMRQVNVPYWLAGAPYPSRAIFWFGQVDPSSNYTDVRLIYDDTQIRITAHIIDRQLRYDKTPTPPELSQWDAVSLYLDLGGNNAFTLNEDSYRFDAQLNWFEARSDYQAAYTGNGTGWIQSSLEYTATTGWRGDGVPNDSLDDKGWVVNYSIPFSSLGLSGPPSKGSLWGLSVVVHDRDDLSIVDVKDTSWPESLETTNPSTWGGLRFGLPGYTLPLYKFGGVTRIQNGLNGALAPDAAVGGGFDCGKDYGPDFWDGWGSANYAGDSQINIQNQWDISDWPCFSKYYVTYPLDLIPNGKTIINATVTMYLTGTAGGGEWGPPPDSYIQALTVGQQWDEATITWNNAPLANENIAGTWVYPKTTNGWVTYTWNVSRAAAQAYESGEPLRLAFYSADGDYHTGKYFASSDWHEIKGRPSLTVTWGDLCTSSDPECDIERAYLPLMQNPRP